MSTSLSHARRSQTVAPNGVVAIEPVGKRIRVRYAGQVVADTTRAVYLLERDHVPVYYLPIADVRAEFLVPADTTSHCPWKGDAHYWDLVVGDRRAADAVWGYPDRFDGALDLGDYVAFYWDRVDEWYEEDEQVFVHPRDPYVRVDVLPSSRHVTVTIGDRVVAETRRPRILFETGLPPRYYLPRIDVATELFEFSDSSTSCPYKGSARYLTYAGPGAKIEDVAWFYPTTTREAAGIENFVCFYDDRVTAVAVEV